MDKYNPKDIEIKIGKTKIDTNNYFLRIEETMYKLKKVKKGDLISMIGPDKFCWNIKAPCVGYILTFKPDKTNFFIPLSKIKEVNKGKEIEF